MQQFLASHGVSSHLIYPGLDTDKFVDLGGKRGGMGAIFHKRHKTKRHRDAVAVSAGCGVPLRLLNRDIVNPSEDELNCWYNKIAVWFSPTELEGLHNPPMEAGLAGCALVCTDHPRAGIDCAVGTTSTGSLRST